MTDNQSKTPLGQRIWDFFASVKLSFVLLLAVAATSILGTVIPQKEHAQAYLNYYGQTKGGLILGLGLDDMYHSPWFLLLLTLLAVNLVVCSLERLPKTLKIVKKDPQKDAARMRGAAHDFKAPKGPDESLAKAESLLGRRMGQVHRAETEGGQVLYAQKGRYSRLGVYAVHMSVLIIFLGAIVGNIAGFSGNMEIAEGQTEKMVDVGRGKGIPLNFSVRLNKATTTYYKDRPTMPSEYRADVTILRGGENQQKAVLKVNHPLTVDGIVFYLSRVGESPGVVKLRMKREGRAEEISLKPRQWNDLPGGGKAGVMEFRPKINMGGKYQGPLARIAYMPKGGGEPHIITAFSPGAKMPGHKDVSFEILEAQSVTFTGLEVKYDPGVWLIWIGCTLMVLGFIVTFYFSHKKVWIKISRTEDGNSRIEIAASANKNRLGVTRLAQKLALDLGDEPQQER